MSAMSKFKGNGNKFKGNNAKKGGRVRKSAFADFNETTDQYAMVVSIEGGKNMNVLPLNNTNGSTVHAIIRGIHHKKVWFKKNDIVIITINGNTAEVQGKVNESELDKVRARFDNLEGTNTGNLLFCNDGELSDNEIDMDNI